MAIPTVRIRSRTAAVSEPCSITAADLKEPTDTRTGEVLEPLRSARFVCVPIDDLKAAKRRLRKPNKAQFNVLKSAIGRFGLVVPILVDADYTIIDGHLIWEVAKALGHKTIPIAQVDYLTEAEISALRIAIHKVGEMSTFDEEVLKFDLNFIIKSEPLLLDFTGLGMPEIDRLTLPELQPASRQEDEGFEPDPSPQREVVSRPGDLWLFEGGHRLLCANSRMAESYILVLGDFVVQMVLSDLPYGMKISGVVSKKRHGEFLEGSDMSPAETLTFFREVLTAMDPVVPAGCIVDLFIDHRSMYALMTAVQAVGFEHLCTAVWSKSPGMGSLYRHAAEFVLVTKKPGAAHINNVQLGRFGRNRTTIWEAPGMASFGAGRNQALESHATRKPVSLLSEAILDTSNQGGVILDPFAGSGSTLVAAHRMKRIGVGIELDPKFVDVIVRRMEAATGAPARHDETGLTFAETAAQRLPSASSTEAA